jgi:hypothetical protein
VYLTTTVLALGLASTSLADGLDPNLIGWWRFDEGAGTTAADSGVNGLDGALVNGPVWRADGLRNGCLFFDGYDDYVQVAQNARLNPGTGSFTVVLCARVTSTLAQRTT